MLYFPFLWWLVVHKSAKQIMMDFQIDLEGWLEESAPFSNQQRCHRITDLYPENEDVPALSTIGDGWLDEKLDLSIFDFQDNWLEPLDDSGKMMVEDASISLILDSLMGNNSTGTDIFTTEDESEAVKILPDLENIAYDVLAHENVSLQGSEYNSFTEELNSPPSEDFSSSVCSPTSSVCSNQSDPLASLQEKKPEIFEYVGLLNESYMLSGPNIKEISGDTESDQSSVGPVFLASNKFRKSPYAAKREARRERKKIQNKEAAARYRTKKRVEDKELGDEVQRLESEQKALQTKHDQLKNEISYLKSLMREMFMRKGLLK